MSERRDHHGEGDDRHLEGRLRCLDLPTCLSLLSRRHAGRLALTDRYGPVVLPVTYVVDTGTVVVQPGATSTLEDSVPRAPASFQVDHIDVPRREGWSVLVRGRLAEVTHGRELDLLASLPPAPLVGRVRGPVVRVEDPAISGRRIIVSDRIPTSWLRPSSDDDATTVEHFRPTGRDPAGWSSWV